MKIKKLEGLYAAPFCAFTEDRKINLEAIPAMAEKLIKDNVSGAFICGSTGEGFSCTVQERLDIMEAWKNAGKGKLHLIAHVGAMNISDCHELAIQAQQMGYDAFSIVPPTFYRPANVEALVEYCKEVASATPDFPFYYYHSAMANLPFSMNRFLMLADGEIPNLCGIKFNNHNLYDFQKCLFYKNGKYDIVFGVDEFFASALAAGATSFIGSTYNYSATLYHDIWAAFKAGDWKTVQKGMDKVCRGVDILVENHGISAGKALMLTCGIDCGPARLPLHYLSPEKRQELADRMQAILDEE